MRRAETSMGAKDEDYSRTANFEHTCTQAAKEMPTHYKAITLQRCFLPFILPCSWPQRYVLSIPVTASALRGLCQLRCTHHLSDTDKLCRQPQWKQWFGSYCAPFWTKRRKALLRASSSSSRDNFPCLVLQEGVMQTRRDVGWVGGLQHGSIFNEKKVASVAWYKHRRLTCALTERDKLERK